MNTLGEREHLLTEPPSNVEEPGLSNDIPDIQRRRSSIVSMAVISSILALCAIFSSLGLIKNTKVSPKDETFTTTYEALPEFKPLSSLDPQSLNCNHIDRPEASAPGDVWGVLKDQSSNLEVSLPTNAWWENIVLGTSQNLSENGIVPLPYSIDTAGDISGMRVHFPSVYASGDRIVQIEFDWRHAFQIGTSRNTSSHTVLEPGPLSITLQWNDESQDGPAFMQSPLVRGSPYISMLYSGVEPMIYLRQEITSFIVDGVETTCSNVTSTITIENEAEMAFSGVSSSDNTWLMFVSEPVEFSCQMTFVEERGDPPTPGALGEMISTPRFTLTALNPMYNGVIRVALSKHCTTKTNAPECNYETPESTAAYTDLLKKHSLVYPTGQSRVSYTIEGSDWVVNEKPLGGAALSLQSIVNGTLGDEGLLQFIWSTATMNTSTSESNLRGSTIDDEELLMYALPHHGEALQGSLMEAGGAPTLHGFASLVVGNIWNMKLDLLPVSFEVKRPVREDMIDDINAALDEDINYQIPDNYLKGAGDTYFSGKMLAKLGRIALIADQMNRHEDAMNVVERLATATEVWFNGSAAAPFVYDYKWGGVVSCGCNYDGDLQTCTNNATANECPGLADNGMNFGAGFYNDHHFHYGYFIYAAAIIAKFKPDWALQYHENILLLVRDIANPSSEDTYFPMFRHKDWYLGSSWASGVVTWGGMPYANGRNQESSSEAVNAYDAVALYGQEMYKIFNSKGDTDQAQVASHIRDTGRMLVTLETNAAQLYWQVKAVDTPDRIRVYPDAFSGKAVGMLWNSMAIVQTWFGTELWKVFGIQMLPITAASENLLDPVWIEQLLPDFEASCMDTTNPINTCIDDGWSMLVNTAQAIAGNQTEARDSINELPSSVFEAAGGNGHSRSNMLWFIATRP